MGAVAWAIWHRPVSHPRSSNWTCGFPASSFPTGFTVRPTMSRLLHAAHAQLARTSSPRDTARSDRSGYLGVCRPKANHPSISVVTSAPESQGPFLRRRYPASSVIRPCPTPADIAIQDSVEAATLMPNGSPPITRITLPACRAHYPGGSNGCAPSGAKFGRFRPRLGTLKSLRAIIHPGMRALRIVALRGFQWRAKALAHEGSEPEHIWPGSRRLDYSLPPARRSGGGLSRAPSTASPLKA